mgnify:CR=1
IWTPLVEILTWIRGSPFANSLFKELSCVDSFLQEEKSNRSKK